MIIKWTLRGHLQREAENIKTLYEFNSCSTHALYIFSKYGYLGKWNSQLSLNFSQMFNKVLHNILIDKKDGSSDWLDQFIGNLYDFAFKNHLNACFVPNVMLDSIEIVRNIGDW